MGVRSYELHDFFIYNSGKMPDKSCMGNERLKGELITEYRKRTKTPYETLAAVLGVSSSTARAMEKGYIPREKRDEILARLAKLLGVDVGALTVQVQVA